MFMRKKDKLSEITRLYTASQQQNKCSSSEALTIIKSNYTADYQQPIQILENIIDNGLDSSKLNSGLWKLLRQLNKCEDGKDIPLLNQYAELEEHRRTLDGYFKKLFSLSFVYVLFLTLVLYVALTIYRTRVLPLFEGFYSEFGVKISDFDRIIMNYNFFSSILTAIFFSLLLYFFWTIRLRIIVARLRPLPRYYNYIPFCRGISKTYLNILQLIYSAALLKSGIEPDIAISYVNNLIINKNKQQLLPLLVAAKLGISAGEIPIQYENQLNYLQRQIRLFHFLILLTFSLIVLSLYWLIIVGMYEPIFNMADVVG